MLSVELLNAQEASEPKDHPVIPQTKCQMRTELLQSGGGGECWVCLLCLDTRVLCGQCRSSGSQLTGSCTWFNAPLSLS